VHVLDLGVLVEPVGAELAADARLLVAAEGRDAVDQVVVVDPHRARPQPLGGLEAAVVVL
jgi:hypothetical protein